MNVQKQESLTQTKLKESLKYDPDTGLLRRKKRRGKLKIGEPAGTVRTDRYVLIHIEGEKYYAHRLAWLYVYGYLPENEIDHINRNAADNRLCNLREVSRQCNAKNYGNRKDNTSGIKGVSWNKKERRWTPCIELDGKQHHLGSYKDFDNAVCARLAAEQRLNWSGCDSDSPAYQYVKTVIQR